MPDTASQIRTLTLSFLLFCEHTVCNGYSFFITIKLLRCFALALECFVLFVLLLIVIEEGMLDDALEVAKDPDYRFDLINLGRLDIAKLVDNLAEFIEHGTPDQQSDALINELSNYFEKCQQLLNSISGSVSTKAMTVEGQKKKLEESEQLLNQRRDLIANYRNSVEELVRSEP
ncbi:Mediator of RNA polymerase II transcription subunit 9 [Spatholobus suberectus]|nr:Mediator of RNA polymerase II transcription subunit 9 [Spatholobus suberectus]